MNDKNMQQFADILSKINSGSKFTEKDRNSLMSMFGNQQLPQSSGILTDDQRYEQIRQKKIKNEKISDEDQKFYKQEIDKRLKNKRNDMRNNRTRNNYHSKSAISLNTQRSSNSNNPIDTNEIQNLLASMLSNTDLLAQAGLQTQTQTHPDPDVEPILDSDKAEQPVEPDQLVEPDENLDDYLFS